MRKVLVLGSTGMLGSAVVKELGAFGFDVQAASRSFGLIFDATELRAKELLLTAGLSPGDYVVNCVGLTKSRIDENSHEDRDLAVKLNVEFPSALAKAAAEIGIRVIQVATDCVYSGATGNYDEWSAHDPLDIYGKTKSIGETPSDSVMHLRCSLIGPELGRSSLFFEWVRRQPSNAQLNGFTDHKWNGLSSVTFGRVVAGVIGADLFIPGVQHLVPSDKVSKDELIRLELRALGRADVLVNAVQSSYSVDRTLATHNQSLNAALFYAAGYSVIPTIEQMVHELCSGLQS